MQQHLPGRRPSNRLMWITPDRVFYAGLLGAPSVRTMGAVMAYVAAEGFIRSSLDGGEWQTTQLAVVPPHTPHRVLSESRLINVVEIWPCCRRRCKAVARSTRRGSSSTCAGVAVTCVRRRTAST